MKFSLSIFGKFAMCFICFRYVGFYRSPKFFNKCKC